MKNVTISLDEELARWARVWAAQHDTSVSKMLASVLKEKMLHERQYEQARDDFFSRDPRRLRSESTSLPTRDEIHER